MVVFKNRFFVNTIQEELSVSNRYLRDIDNKKVVLP